MEKMGARREKRENRGKRRNRNIKFRGEKAISNKMVRYKNEIENEREKVSRTILLLPSKGSNY